MAAEAPQMPPTEYTPTDSSGSLLFWLDGEEGREDVKRIPRFRWSAFGMLGECGYILVGIVLTAWQLIWAIEPNLFFYILSGRRYRVRGFDYLLKEIPLRNELC